MLQKCLLKNTARVHREVYVCLHILICVFIVTKSVRICYTAIKLQYQYKTIYESTTVNLYRKPFIDTIIQTIKHFIEMSIKKREYIDITDTFFT